jgi:apolipoprotein N-acyltransferase
MEEHPNLAEALERHQRDKELTLRRRVRSFANRMWAVCFVAVSAAILLALAAQTWGRSRDLLWMGYVMAGFLALAWLYACVLLAVFWWRTGLTAHILHSYWIWLAMLVGAPIDFARLLHGSLLVPVWLVLVLAGSLLWRWRIKRSDAELRHRAADWDRLFDLTWNDLILIRFPRLRDANPS